MEAQYNFGSINSFKTPKGNIIWGAALTLAWKQFSEKIIKQPIKIQSSDKNANTIADNFNKSKISKVDLSPECYYIKSGFGNNTVKQINEQVSKKFKGKTTAAIAQNIPKNGIISYAYFFKSMQFQYSFTRSQVDFNKGFIDGFKATNTSQKKQLSVHKYNDRQSFIVELSPKFNDQQIFLIKSKVDQSCEQILSKLPQQKQTGVRLSKADIFQMPILSIHCKHSIPQLVNVKLANSQFEDYHFSQILQIVKLDMDEKGVKIQNEGVIKTKRCRKQKPVVQIKYIVLDRPFWIVMRQRGKANAYFMAYINCATQK